MNLTITFVRHSIATKKDASKKGAAADIGRVLTPEGVALAEATSLALAGEDFDIMITSHVLRTVQTGLAIAANQRNLREIVGVQELYAPINMARADALFDELPKPRQNMANKWLCDYYTVAATVLMREITARGAEKTVVVNHGNVIQMLIAILGRERFNDVLDVELAPCDSIRAEMSMFGELIRYEVVRAPKMEG